MFKFIFLFIAFPSISVSQEDMKCTKKILCTLNYIIINNDIIYAKEKTDSINIVMLLKFKEDGSIFYVKIIKSNFNINNEKFINEIKKYKFPCLPYIYYKAPFYTDGIFLTYKFGICE